MAMTERKKTTHKQGAKKNSPTLPSEPFTESTEAAEKQKHFPIVGIGASAGNTSGAHYRKCFEKDFQPARQDKRRLHTG